MAKTKDSTDASTVLDGGFFNGVPTAAPTAPAVVKEKLTPEQAAEKGYESARIALGAAHEAHAMSDAKLKIAELRYQVAKRKHDKFELVANTDAGIPE